MQYLADVYEFHEKFQIPQPSNPTELDDETETFRLEFILEEAAEYEEAVIKKDLVAQLDALVDIVYVALGAALMKGLDFDEAWRRVHAANMRKIAGLPTGRHGTLDVSKPEGWKPPELSDLVDPSHKRIVP